jgi:repressor LexA
VISPLEASLIPRALPLSLMISEMVLMATAYTELNSTFQAQNSILPEKISSYCFCMTWDRRLREKFEKTGWSKAEFSRRSRVSYDNVNKYLSGKVDKPRGRTLAMLAEPLGMTALELEYGLDDASGSSQVPLMGYIGAGAEISPDFEQVPDDGIEQISLPFHLAGDTIAFQVRGDSMYPRFNDGDVVIVWRDQQLRAESYIGLEAAVRTSDGRRFIKIIRNGTSGLYLESHNAPPIIGVALVWIGGVAATIPANQIRRSTSIRSRSSLNR